MWLKYNLILNLFIAVVVCTTLALVSYIVLIFSTTNDSVPVKFRKISYVWSSNHVTGGGQHVIYPNHSGSFLDKIPDFSNRSIIHNSVLMKRFKEKGPPLVSLTTEQHCRNVYCSEFLNRDDLDRFKYCSNITNVTPVQRKLPLCHFINQTYRRPVALVSLPGSGNTWARGLLETSTGMCTGAVYCDISLRTRGFVGEYIRGGTVLVVKTHEDKPKWIQTHFQKLDKNDGLFGSGILIVRNPFDALIAEWNRKVANKFNARTIILDSHIKAAGKNWFGE